MRVPVGMYPRGNTLKDTLRFRPCRVFFSPHGGAALPVVVGAWGRGVDGFGLGFPNDNITHPTSHKQ